MYLKTPYNTVEEVKKALPDDVEGLTVELNEGINYVCVDFPESTPHEVYKRVEKHLNDQGIEAY